MLPVSGLELLVREPTGEDELFVVETALAPLPALVELLSRVARGTTGTAIRWSGLPATDLDAAVLVVRRTWIGDAIQTDVICPVAGCRQRIDVSFGIGEYLEHHRPQRTRSVTEGAEAGWFTLIGSPVRFRIPTVDDLLAAADDAWPAAALAARCVSTAEIPYALARRLDRALSTLAPRLDDLIGGNCPACGHEVAIRFDPQAYALVELRQAFSGIYLETHVVASAYNWAEEVILAMPRSRRRRYASIIAAERSVA